MAYFAGQTVKWYYIGYKQTGTTNSLFSIEGNKLYPSLESKVGNIVLELKTQLISDQEDVLQLLLLLTSYGGKDPLAERITGSVSSKYGTRN